MIAREEGAGMRRERIEGKGAIQIRGKRGTENEREGGRGTKERGKERKWRTQGKTITYPSCTPRAHFHPSKRGKESHRLRYANYPLRGTCTYTDIHATRAHIFYVWFMRTRVCLLYTPEYSSSSRRTLPRPRETEVGFSLYG